MRNVIALVLGGGKGTRLYPLTRDRSKPAVPLAGKFRLIDIPISNCINSGCNAIYLLTQFNSVSLHRHIRDAYSFDRFGGGFVEILAAQQSLEWENPWYQGTADAVRKNLRYVEQPGVDLVLILSGDQLYRMDYRALLETHFTTGADVTIAAVPVTHEEASAFGILRCAEDGRIVGFREKPKSEEDLQAVRTEPEWMEARGVPSGGRDCLASMGIYLFNRDKLVDLLRNTQYEDFGKEVFPAAMRTLRVHVHLFNGYWQDIGTIRSFYEANLALADPCPPFEFALGAAPIYTQAQFLPPPRIEGADISRSIVCDGSIVSQGAVIDRSVLGLRCLIGPNVTIRNSIIMGADSYPSAQECAESDVHKAPAIGIGEGTRIERAIVDMNCRIGRNVSITLEETEMPDLDLHTVMIRDGIAVVPGETSVPDGWSLQKAMSRD